MLEKDKFTVINIREFLSGKTKGLGENELQSLLSEFSCTKNPDVEYFLKKNAIEFTKKNQSVTYLVLETETAEVVGYFTIAIKPISLNADMWSKSVLRKISRVGKLNMKDNTYRLSDFCYQNRRTRFDSIAEIVVNKDRATYFRRNHILTMYYNRES